MNIIAKPRKCIGVQTATLLMRADMQTQRRLEQCHLMSRSDIITSSTLTVYLVLIILQKFKNKMPQLNLSTAGSWLWFESPFGYALVVACRNIRGRSKFLSFLTNHTACFYHECKFNSLNAVVTTSLFATTTNNIISTRRGSLSVIRCN